VVAGWVFGLSVPRRKVVILLFSKSLSAVAVVLVLLAVACAPAVCHAQGFVGSFGNVSVAVGNPFGAVQVSDLAFTNPFIASRVGVFGSPVVVNTGFGFGARAAVAQANFQAFQAARLNARAARVANFQAAQAVRAANFNAFQAARLNAAAANLNAVRAAQLNALSRPRFIVSPGGTLLRVF
jgi:hypothetical protein